MTDEFMIGYCLGLVFGLMLSYLMTRPSKANS